MKKKETEREVEMGKNQQEQIEPVKKKRGRPKASETKEISELSENLEEKKQIFCISIKKRMLRTKPEHSLCYFRE